MTCIAIEITLKVHGQVINAVGDFEQIITVKLSKDLQ
jgi:hypothetical protein